MEPLNPLSLHSRRHFLAQASLCGAAWMTGLGAYLARAAAPPGRSRQPARSLIVLWMQGGPSQLETFDPHPGKKIAGGTEAIATSVRGVQFAAGLEQTAEQMHSLAVIRSMISKEGDHERGTYTLKTGFVPDPTVVHPAIGAILCHELPEAGTEIPRHVSILPNQWSARGGYLGEQYDAFRTYDPAQPVPDTKSFLSKDRDGERLQHLQVIERAFARRRNRADSTLHRSTVEAARRMMTSEQLSAFDVSREPLAVRRAYGDTPFGRACLAARRLTEVGVRCIEVTLDGWDTHVNNHSLTAGRVAILDPALAALIRDLRERGTLDHTLVVVMGEFGRTPSINPAGGRDHWPNGFSVVLAGGGIRRGTVVGATDPEGKDKPTRPVHVEDLHATILAAMGVDGRKLNQTPIGRTVRFSEGTPLKELLPG